MLRVDSVQQPDAAKRQRQRCFLSLYAGNFDSGLTPSSLRSLLWYEPAVREYGLIDSGPDSTLPDAPHSAGRLSDKRLSRPGFLRRRGSPADAFGRCFETLPRLNTLNHDAQRPDWSRS